MRFDDFRHYTGSQGRPAAICNLMRRAQRVTAATGKGRPALRVGLRERLASRNGLRARGLRAGRHGDAERATGDGPVHGGYGALLRLGAGLAHVTRFRQETSS